MVEWCRETLCFLGAQYTVFIIIDFTYDKLSTVTKGWEAWQSVSWSRRESAVLSCQVARQRYPFFTDAAILEFNVWKYKG